MSGIKDGSITFDNNRFHDSKGRYSNAEKKDKDYYGIMANYIYNNSCTNKLWSILSL